MGRLGWSRIGLRSRPSSNAGSIRSAVFTHYGAIAWTMVAHRRTSRWTRQGSSDGRTLLRTSSGPERHRGISAFQLDLTRTVRERRGANVAPVLPFRAATALSRPREVSTKRNMIVGRRPEPDLARHWGLYSVCEDRWIPVMFNRRREADEALLLLSRPAAVVRSPDR